MSRPTKEPSRQDPTGKKELAVDQPATDQIADQDLILWSKSLSPEARLDVLQDFVDAFWTPVHG